MNSKELLEAINALIKARDTNGVDVQTVIDFLVEFWVMIIESKPTDLVVWFVYSTGRGSDYFGSCKVCNKSVSEHFVARQRGVWVRENGQHTITSYIGDGVYGHMECLNKSFGELIDKSGLQREGRSYLLPQHMIDKLRSAHASK